MARHHYPAALLACFVALAACAQRALPPAAPSVSAQSEPEKPWPSPTGNWTYEQVVGSETGDTGSLTAVLTDTTGAFLVGATVIATLVTSDKQPDPTGNEPTAFTVETGAFTLTNLTPGSYIVRIFHIDQALDVKVHIVAGKTATAKLERWTPDPRKMIVTDR